MFKFVKGLTSQLYLQIWLNSAIKFDLLLWLFDTEGSRQKPDEAYPFYYLHHNKI